MSDEPKVKSLRKKQSPWHDGKVWKKKGDPKRELRSDEIEAIFRRVPLRYEDSDPSFLAVRYGTTRERLIERDRAVIAFIYLFGCRPSEICRGEVRNYKTIRREAGSKETIPLTEFKPLDVYSVRVEEDMIVARIPVLKRRERWTHTIRVSAKTPYSKYIVDYLKRRKQEAKPYETLFPITSATAWRIISGALDKSQPRQLRHFRLNWLADRGGTLKDLQEWAGWKGFEAAEDYLSRAGRGIERFGKEIE